MIFEVMDFPPLMWIIDAHSLWHFATAGLPFLFYRYVRLHILTTQSLLSIYNVITQQKIRILTCLLEVLEKIILPQNANEVNPQNYNTRHLVTPPSTGLLITV